MIKVILVRLKGDGKADELRLAAASGLAELFDARFAGLLVNELPSPVAPLDAAATNIWGNLLAEARQTGDTAAKALSARLAAMNRASELRRFDVIGDNVGHVCGRETRTADVFVTLRPADKGYPERPDVIESVLFRGGRHLFLVTEDRDYSKGFDHVVIAWNGSREAARALAEARPYLLAARAVTVLVIDKGVPLEIDELIGDDVVSYLDDHSIPAKLCLTKRRADVTETVIEEVVRLKADLLVMGGYGHSRLAEWLLGGTTWKMLRNAPVPLLIAH